MRVEWAAASLHANCELCEVSRVQRGECELEIQSLPQPEPLKAASGSALWARSVADTSGGGVKLLNSLLLSLGGSFCSSTRHNSGWWRFPRWVISVAFTHPPASVYGLITLLRLRGFPKRSWNRNKFRLWPSAEMSVIHRWCHSPCGRLASGFGDPTAGAPGSFQWRDARGFWLKKKQKTSKMQNTCLRQWIGKNVFMARYHTHRLL